MSKTPAIILPLLLASSLHAQLTNPIPTGTTSANLFRLATIPIATTGEPLDMAVAPGDSLNRLYVVDHKGYVSLIKNNSLQATPFLNLSARGVTVLGGTGSDERGLLGLAFHPNFNAPIGTPGRGLFYTYTSETKVGNADFSHPEIGLAGGTHQSVIREWTVNLSNPDVADATVAPRILMRIAEPQDNHNGGALRFDSAGNLYISLGDGGGGDDNNGGINSTTDGHTSPNGNGQDTTNVYGKILRINPLGANSVNGKYGVPSDNPFFGSLTAVNEIFAYGLRNPFRMNFDKPTGKLYVGDVGQGAREEVDIVTSGQNYGWAYMEGTLASTLRTPPAGFTSVPPIAEYTHVDGHSVIGGFVYHGSVPEFQGKYIFGDYNGSTGSQGRLFYMDQNGGAIFQFNTSLSSGLLYAFGEDADGEIYAMMNTGAVDKLLANNAWNVDGGGSWGTLANWTPNTALPSDARFLNRLTRTNAPATINLDGDRLINSLTISNPNQYIIAQGTSGTLSVGSGGVHVLRGSHIISASFNWSASGVAEIAAGAQLQLNGPIGFSGGGTTKIGAGTLIFNGPQTHSTAQEFDAMFVSDGALIVSNNTGVPANALTPATTKLWLAAQRASSGVTDSLIRFDADQDLNDLSSDFAGPGLQSIDFNSPSTPGAFRSVRVYWGHGPSFRATYDYLAAGIWNAVLHPGDGILDSRIAGDSNKRIGILQTVDAFGQQHYLMRPTRIGDLNLDGSVSIADFIELAAHFNQTGMRWQDGDINYDNAVTIADFIALAANFNQSYAGDASPIDPAQQKMLNDFYLANVPEPTALFGVLSACLYGLCSRAGRSGRAGRI